MTCIRNALATALERIRMRRATSTRYMSGCLLTFLGFSVAGCHSDLGPRRALKLTDPEDLLMIQRVHEIPLHRIAGSSSAPVRRVSLPVQRSRPDYVFADAATQATPLAWWPTADPGEPRRYGPRRIMLTAIGAGEHRIRVTEGQPNGGVYHGPMASVKVVDQQYDTPLPWEINEVRFQQAGAELGVRLGLHVGDTIHWWQWVRLEILDDGPVCRIYRAKGAIPVVREDVASEEARRAATEEGDHYPWLHRHNHVRGELVARCYANGTIELNLRHINTRFFTEGGDLQDVIPVIGFTATGGDWPAERTPVTTRGRWHWDHASLDLAEAAWLVGPEHPGYVWRTGDVCVYQPYEGIEAMAGRHARNQTGDPYLARAADRVFPKGMARTVRLVAGLNDAEPEVARYLAPDWWYGMCEEFADVPFLPVRDHTWKTVEKSLDYYHRRHHANCFDDGAIHRGGPFLRKEPGWEGEAPHAQFIGAYLTGDIDDYGLAMRSAYHVADVAVDKTIYAVRMHGYVPPAQSLPMQRTMGLVAAYLESGDPYLLETARAVSESAYWWDTHNWPRRSYGRDAAYIRSLIYLYRCFGEQRDLDRARDALGRLIACQRPDGSFADQGDTTGIHAAFNLIVKPWMGCIAAETMIDYLRWAKDPEIERAALKFARWLLDCRVEGEHGRHWVYQTSFNDQDVGYRLSGEAYPLGRHRWHVEYLAKIMAWASMRTGEPEFYQAWYEAYAPHADEPEHWDHGANKVVTNIPWQRQYLWAVLPTTLGTFVLGDPDLAPDLREAEVSTPQGRQPIHRDPESGQIQIVSP